MQSDSSGREKHDKSAPTRELLYRSLRSRVIGVRRGHVDKLLIEQTPDSPEHTIECLSVLEVPLGP